MCCTLTSRTQTVLPNHRINPIAERLRCSGPAQLRAAAVGYAGRWAAEQVVSVSVKARG